MTRDRNELFEMALMQWLETCPYPEWRWAGENKGCIHILFKIDEGSENETGERHV